MALLSCEDFANKIKEAYAENLTDEALEDQKSIMETVNDLFSKASKINELEKEKEALDKSWREKYRNAFFSPAVSNGTTEPESEEDKSEKIQFADLFK